MIVLNWIFKGRILRQIFHSINHLTWLKSKRWTSRSWIAWRLKLSSTLVYGQNHRWTRETKKRIKKTNNQCIINLKDSIHQMRMPPMEKCGSMLDQYVLFRDQLTNISTQNGSQSRIYWLTVGLVSIQTKFYFPSSSFASCSSLIRSSETYFANNSCFLRSNNARSI